MAAGAETGTQETVGYWTSPNAEICVNRKRGVVTIEFVAPKGKAPIVLAPLLSGEILRAVSEGMPMLRLPMGYNFATVSWATVCILAQLGLGGGVVLRAVEQHQPLSIKDAQIVLLELVAALGGSTTVNPHAVGRALSTCVYWLGKAASDVHDVLGPLRRAGEVSRLVVAA